MDKKNKANICGKRIKLARVKNDMAQVDLIAALEVDFGIKLAQTTISQIEKGKRMIRDFELDAIAKALNVDPQWLLQGDTDN